MLLSGILHKIEQMGEDLQRRLRRLGVVRGARNLKPAPTRSLTTANSETTAGSSADLSGEQSLELLLPGSRLVETQYGACLVLDSVYPLSFDHGWGNLAQLLALSMAPSATFCRDERLAKLEYRDYLFLDTETTGLTGAGTIAFMVGAAYFEDGAFVVRQYFLRDHGDEASMLLLLAELLAEKAGLITFNGRSFDLPLLDNRYLMNRLDGLVGDLLERPHVDLLPAARRLWRRRVGSCSLSSLEQNVLGLDRSHEDVPGWAIPGLYLDYLRSGDAHPLLRVFYHNRIDMLSMVTLTSYILRQFAQPSPEDPAFDLFSLAKWQIALGLSQEAEDNLRLIAGQELPLALYHQTLHELGLLLKRDERRDEAVQLWQQIAVTSLDDVAAHVELAKHYEWQQLDLHSARSWTRQAIALVDSNQTTEARTTRAELVHRLARLERKLGQDAKD